MCWFVNQTEVPHSETQFSYRFHSSASCLSGIANEGSFSLFSEFHHVEFRGGWNGQHPLEGAAPSSAGLPHLRVSPHGAHLHQVPA